MGESLLYGNFPDFISRDLMTSTALDSRMLLKCFIQSLESFPPCLDKRPELATAVKGLFHVADNFLALKSRLSAKEQYRQMYPLRCWIVWLPESFVLFTQVDIWTLIMVAHMCALMLAVVPLFPAVNSRLSIKLRVESILSIYENLCNRPSLSCSTCLAHHSSCEHMQFPMSVINTLIQAH